MANEISIIVKLNALINGINAAAGSNAAITRDWTDTSGHWASVVQDVGTTSAGELLKLPSEIATAGYGYFQNAGAANVQIGSHDGSSNFIAHVLLKPGDACMYRLNSVNTYLKAASGTQQVVGIVLAD